LVLDLRRRCTSPSATATAEPAAAKTAAARLTVSATTTFAALATLTAIAATASTSTPAVRWRTVVLLTLGWLQELVDAHGLLKQKQKQLQHNCCTSSSKNRKTTTKPSNQPLKP
jgi:hypothetical protein